jgi:hypothetical protein
MSNPDGSEKSDAALLQFLSRPYWRRVWIVQELAFSRTTIVHCGEKETSWEALAIGVSRIHNNSLKSSPEVVNMLNLIQFRQDANAMKPLPIVAALFRTQAALSTDPRDKVFALLGLAYDAPFYVPVPNYKQSREDLAIAINISGVATTGKCDIIAFLAPRRDNSLGIPSWAIDWFHMESDKSRGVNYLTAHMTEAEDSKQLEPHELTASQHYRWSFGRRLLNYHADGNKRSNISVSSGVLLIQGIVFDEIDGTCPTAEEFQPNSTLSPQHQSIYTENAYEDSMDLWRHIISTLTRHFPGSFDTRSVLPGSILLSLADRYSLLIYLAKSEHAESTMWIQKYSDQRAIVWLFYSSVFHVSGKTLLDLARGRLGHDTGPDESILDRYWPIDVENNWLEGDAEAILAPVLDDNMRFMTTKKGYVGWSHIRGKRRDKICILEGCSVPVILRARENGGYTLVGDAYVSGIMDGEASGALIETLEIH